MERCEFICLPLPCLFAISTSIVNYCCYKFFYRLQDINMPQDSMKTKVTQVYYLNEIHSSASSRNSQLVFGICQRSFHLSIMNVKWMKQYNFRWISQMVVYLFFVWHWNSPKSFPSMCCKSKKCKRIKTPPDKKSISALAHAVNTWALHCSESVKCGTVFYPIYSHTFTNHHIQKSTHSCISTPTHTVKHTLSPCIQINTAPHQCHYTKTTKAVAVWRGERTETAERNN